jgi:hypothetical protein
MHQKLVRSFNDKWKESMMEFRPQSSWMLRALGLLLVVTVISACSSSQEVAPSAESGVESRGLPQAQRPMKPGTSMQSAASGSPTKQKFQLPTWPQKFDVQGAEVSSFGFAVTQPGPITVDVQAQGPPLLVTLQAVGGQPIRQQATGSLRMSYNVTPQDVQRSLLWAVQIRLAQPLPPQQGGRATGTLNVQHPPVNESQIEAAVRTRVEQARKQSQLNSAQLDSAKQALLLARKNEADRQYHDYIRGTESQLDAFLKQKPPRDPVQSRALKSPREQSPALRPAPAVLPASPHIDRLSVTQGPPGTTVIIEGSGFTDFVGTVSMTTPNGTVLATVLGGAQPIWAEGFVAVRVPDQTGVLPYTANISVHLDFERFGLVESNRVPFNFVPRQEVRVITRITDDHRLSDPSLGAYPAFTKDNSVHHTRFSPWLAWPLNASPFFGVKEKDYFFEKTQLKNGWRLDCVQVLPYDPRMCAAPPGPTTVTAYNVPPGSGAYVDAGSSPGSGLGTAKPMFYVTWWLEAFIPEMEYSYAMTISGPAGTPDGIQVP